MESYESKETKEAEDGGQTTENAMHEMERNGGKALQVRSTEGLWWWWALLGVLVTLVLTSFILFMVVLVRVMARRSERKAMAIAMVRRERYEWHRGSIMSPNKEQNKEEFFFASPLT